MATDGGISDNAIINETRPRAGVSSGWASLGNALGGGQSQSGGLAYDRGMQIGAQTVDALAQAKDRIQKTQMAHQAANAIRSPTLGQIFHLDPTEQEYLASGTEAGTLTPDDLVKYVTGKQQYTQRAALADPTVNPDVRLGSALALDPAGAVPKAEGPLGTVIAPLSPGYNPNAALSPTNSPVSVGGPQLAQSQATINKDNADAASARASVPQKQAETNLANTRARTLADPANVPPNGMRIKLDPDTLEPVRDNTGRYIFEQKPGVPLHGEGATNQRYMGNMIGAATQLVNELENVRSIGDTESSGLTSLGTGHGGVGGTVLGNLGLAGSSDAQQRYHQSMGNIGRFVTTLESGGRLAPETTSASIQRIIEAYPGNTDNSRRYGLALARQILEGQQVRMDSGGASEAEKAAYLGQVKRGQTAIPYTPEDINEYGKLPQPGKFEDFVKQRRAQDAAMAGVPPVAQGGGPAPVVPANSPPPGTRLVN